MPSSSIVVAKRTARVERPIALPGPFSDVVGALRRPGAPNLVLEGDGTIAAGEGWGVAPLVAIDPGARVLARRPAEAARAFAAIAALVGDRRARVGGGGSAATGIAMIASYEAGRSALMGAGVRAAPDACDAVPAVVAWTVDRSVRWTAAGDARLTVVSGDPHDVDALAKDLCRRVSRAGATMVQPARVVGAPGTSLPRERYLRSVERVLEHIRRGDVYQANLCQRFSVPIEGDTFAWHREQVVRSPAPRAAWAELPGAAIASASPETFLRMTPEGRVETWPVKGTRARVTDPEADARVAGELLASPKDRAELLMIVDLERNDLGRFCRVGSVEVPELATLRSYSTVHHLVARVIGSLAPDAGLQEWLAATFPGGSITGAPKRRAMEILEAIEPVPRGWFTGSLIWFGDDGSVDSSILIRSPVFCGGHAFVGAGGGIVADSDPLAEWRESNHKARGAAELLGFDPEQAR